MNSEGNPESKCYLCVEIILEEFRCLGNCPICGKCSFLRGREAEDLYAGYIEGAVLSGASQQNTGEEAIGGLLFCLHIQYSLWNQ